MNFSLLISRGFVKKYYAPLPIVVTSRTSKSAIRRLSTSRALKVVSVYNYDYDSL